MSLDPVAVALQALNILLTTDAQIFWVGSNLGEWSRRWRNLWRAESLELLHYALWLDGRRERSGCLWHRHTSTDKIDSSERINFGKNCCRGQQRPTFKRSECQQPGQRSLRLRKNPESTQLNWRFGSWTNPFMLTRTSSLFFQKRQVFNPKGTPRITVVDCGLKYNQIRCFLKRGARVTVVGWDDKLNPSSFDGLFVASLKMNLADLR